MGPKPVRSTWDGSSSEVEDFLKRRANDPKSIEITECTPVYNTDDGWLVGAEHLRKMKICRWLGNDIVARHKWCKCMCLLLFRLDLPGCAFSFSVLNDEALGKIGLKRIRDHAQTGS